MAPKKIGPNFSMHKVFDKGVDAVANTSTEILRYLLPDFCALCCNAACFCDNNVFVVLGICELLVTSTYVDDEGKAADVVTEVSFLVEGPRSPLSDKLLPKKTRML